MILTKMLYKFFGLEIVNWQCFHCNHKHSWRWDWEEVYTPSRTSMECAKCGKKSIYIFDGRGIYFGDEEDKKRVKNEKKNKSKKGNKNARGK